VSLAAVQQQIWRVESSLVARAYRAIDLNWGAGDPLWRRVLNGRATAHQRRDPLRHQSAAAAAAAATLSRDGIAMLSVSDLQGAADVFDRARSYERHVVAARREDIEARRAAAMTGGGYKGYLVRHEPGEGALRFDDPAVQLLLHPGVLAIVNEALGLYSQLRKLEFWYTLATPGHQAQYSQLWHRDYEDMKLVKAFVYLEDVGPGSGPFSFVRGTHTGSGLHGSPPRVTTKAANRFDDEEMERWVPRERWCTATGAAGTIVLAITKGFHKGGLATTADRRLLTASYLSPWCRDYFLPTAISGVPSHAHPAVRWAAGLE
jgi:hypothetical protein